jgi:Fe2+ transport system protein FeoA
MKLSEMEKGQRAIIKDIKLDGELKQRLSSLGLIKNELIHICRVGFMKGSFYIKTGCDSCIIISKNEADHIEVELYGKGHQHRWGKRFKADSCVYCCQEEES